MDLSGVTGSESSASHVEASSRMPLDASRLAIVAPRPAQFGSARRFEIIAGLNRIAGVHVFKTRKEALVWLREKAKAATECGPV